MIKFSQKQKEAIRGATHKWNILIGATRSGKSHVQTHMVPRRIEEFRGRPGLRMLIAKTLGSVESNLLIPMRGMYGASHVGRMRIKDGLMVVSVFGCPFVCMGGDNLRSIDKLRGKEVAYVAGDEAPTWPYELFQMLVTRLVKEWCKADLTGNPEGPFHWFKKDLLERAGNMDIFHKSFGLNDNPTLTEKEKESLRNSLTGVWYRRLILGEWATADGAVYDMLDKDIHIVKGCVPVFRNYIFGDDFGMNHPTAGALIGWNTPDEIVQVSEYNYSKSAMTASKTVSKIVRAQAKWLYLCNIRKIDTYYDPSALVLREELEEWNNEFSEKSDTPVIFDIKKTKNSQIQGIKHMSELFASGKFKFHESCKVSWRQHCNLTWDKKAQENGEDKVVKIEDDQPDAVRYPVYSRFGKMIKKKSGQVRMF